MALHISQFEDKTAEILAESELIADSYHNAIKAAAKVLVDHAAGYAVYGGQWSSGTTFWHGRNIIFKVDREGNITS